MQISKLSSDNSYKKEVLSSFTNIFVITSTVYLTNVYLTFYMPIRRSSIKRILNIDLIPIAMIKIAD